jgi:hypothetical protein
MPDFFDLSGTGCSIQPRNFADRTQMLQPVFEWCGDDAHGISGVLQYAVSSARLARGKSGGLARNPLVNAVVFCSPSRRAVCTLRRSVAALRRRGIALTANEEDT